jgi:hypothetical protein
MTDRTSWERRKWHCSGYLAISTIAAALALFVGAPVGASAAAEEHGGGLTSGEAVVGPPGNSTQPGAPPATEGVPQDVEGDAPRSAGAPPVRGSSVGSGAVTEEAGAGSDDGASSYTPESSGSYEPESSTPSTFDEPASTPGAEGGVDTVQSTVTAAPGASTAADAAVGGAGSAGHSASPQSSGIDSAPPAAAASFADLGDRGSTSSYALSLLALIVLGLILGFAGVRLVRRRRRRRLEALWRRQDAVWEAALLQAEQAQVYGGSSSGAQPLQRVNAA